MNAIMTLTMIVLNVIKTFGDCPRSCECKWKSGKESVLCVNASLTEIPRELDSGTQVLVLTGNRLQKIGADEFFNASLLNLQKVFLSRCKLRIIDRCSFRKITNLVELDLSYNDLHSVPSHTFEFIKELRELRLNGNPIVRLLNYAFRMVPRLTKLDLSECRIAFVEIKAFHGLENSLEWLKLDKNKIANVKPQALVNLGNLHGLELSGNSWNCSCGLRTLREWMLRENVPHDVTPTCRHPPRLSGKPWDKLELDEFACPPRAEAATPRKRGEEGSNVTVSCRIDGVPPPKVRWLKKNREIETLSGGRNKFYVRTAKQTSNLTILAVDAHDGGVYVCRVENKAGNSESNVTLEVTSSPGGKIWPSRTMAAVGAVSVLFVAAVALFACCFRNFSKRKSQEQEVAVARRPPDGYEMKYTNPIGYNKIGDYRNHCSLDSGDNLRRAADRSYQYENVRSWGTAYLSGKGYAGAEDSFGSRRSGNPKSAGWVRSSPHPQISGPDGRETRGKSPKAESPSPESPSLTGSPACSGLLGSDAFHAFHKSSAFSTHMLPENDYKFPDLLELSQNEENLINNNPFVIIPRKSSRGAKRGRFGNLGSDSRDSNCSRNGRATFERIESPHRSPAGLSQTPILDVLGGSSIALVDSPSALSCKSWELEKFLKEYRNIQYQLCRMKESCENLRMGNLKFREDEFCSNSVESATISKLIPPVYLEEPFANRFPEDGDDFESFYRGAALGEDNDNTTSPTKSKSGSSWPGRNEIFRTSSTCRIPYYKT